MRIILFGVFDYFHLGHLRLFKQAKTFADYLIVAVQNNNYVLKFKPDAKILYNTEEKIEIISSIKEVNEVIEYKELTPNLLKILNFDILALGEDQIGKRFDDLTKWCEQNEKKWVRLKRTQGICSSQIKTNLL